MSQRQALHFELIRSGQFSMREIGVLEYINSYSNICAPPKLELMAKALQCSDRTIRRIIDMLVIKGVLTKRYTVHKRVILRIVSLTEQMKLIGNKMANSLFDNILKLKKKVSHRSNMSGVYRSPMSESIQNKKLLEQNINKEFKFSEKRKDPATELAKYREYLLAQGKNVSF